MTERTLIRGGIVLTQDPSLGELARADVLIDGDTIAEVGPDLSAETPGSSTPRATSSSRVHRHPPPHLGDVHPDLRAGLHARRLLRNILDKFAPNYRPDDVYAANLWGALECINAGITTLVDWSHIMNTPEHADAAIKALQESGIRSVFAYGFPNTSLQDWWFGPTTRAAC